LKNDTILDPFSGTGTTLRNAIEVKRNAIGYELNKDFIIDIIRYYHLEQKGDIYHGSTPYSESSSSITL
jgi:DNA modification methylase